MDLRRDGRALSCLQLGCGDSVLAEELYDDLGGCCQIVNIDWSPTVIKKMQNRAPSLQRHGLSYKRMDARELEFQRNQFDVVIDKGTVDAILCDAQGDHHLHTINMEVSRVLKPGGIYFVISYREPTARTSHYNQPCFNWAMKASHELCQTHRRNFCYLYVMQAHAMKSTQVLSHSQEVSCQEEEEEEEEEEEVEEESLLDID